MTKILGLFLFFLLSLFLRDGVEKHLIFKNRVPIGQVEQQIVYSMSSITQKKFNSLRRSGKLTLNNDLKSTVLDGRYDFSGDSIFILQSNFRGLLDKDFSEINFGYNISKFLQDKYLWNTKNIPFDSLYSVHLDSTFIIQVPYGSRSKFYCIEFYDPCPKFGPQIFSDFCNVYRSYITF